MDIKTTIDNISNEVHLLNEIIENHHSQSRYDSSMMLEDLAFDFFKIIYPDEEVINLNKDVQYDFPCADILLKKQNKFIQVTTQADLSQKIKNTYKTLRTTKEPMLKKVNRIYFFVVDDNRCPNLVPYGKYKFIKSRHLYSLNNFAKLTRKDFGKLKSIGEAINTHYAVIKDYVGVIDQSKSMSNISIKTTLCDGYAIERNTLFKDIDCDNSNIILVYGESGCGKSAFVKKYLESNEKPFIYVKGPNLNTKDTSLNSVFNCDINSFIPYLYQDLFVFIDAVEHVELNENGLTILDQLYRLATENKGIKLIITCRKSYLQVIGSYLGDYAFKAVYVPPLDDKELQAIFNRYQFIKRFVDNSNTPHYLKNLRYLNLIISNKDVLLEVKKKNELRNFVWTKLICTSKEEQVFFIQYAESKISNPLTNFFNENINNKLVSSLLSRDILTNDKDNILFHDDLYEDLCYDNYFNQLFNKGDDLPSFFDALNKNKFKNSRRYKEWLQTTCDDSDCYQHILLFLLKRASLPVKDHWLDLTIDAILELDNGISFYDNFYNHLLEDEDFLKRCIHITEVNCFLFDKALSNIIDFPLLSPIGFSRGELIDFLNNNYSDKYYDDLIRICLDYATQRHSFDIKHKITASSIITKEIDKIFNISDEYEFYDKRDYLKQLLCGIAFMGDYCSDWLTSFLKKINNKRYFSGVSDFVCDFVLSINFSPAAKTHFAELSDLALSNWFFKDDSYGDSLRTNERNYGLNQHAIFEMRTNNDYKPFFIFHGAIDKPLEVTSFIVKFTNEITKSYYQNQKASKVLINGKEIVATSEFIMYAYQKDFNVGTLINSTLDIYEKSLENLILNNRQVLYKVVHKIIKSTNNIMPIVVLYKLASKYPTVFKDTLMFLDNCKEIKDIDNYLVERGLIKQNESLNHYLNVCKNSNDKTIDLRKDDSTKFINNTEQIEIGLSFNEIRHAISTNSFFFDKRPALKHIKQSLSSNIYSKEQFNLLFNDLLSLLKTSVESLENESGFYIYSVALPEVLEILTTLFDTSLVDNSFKETILRYLFRIVLVDKTYELEENVLIIINAFFTKHKELHDNYLKSVILLAQSEINKQKHYYNYAHKYEQKLFEKFEPNFTKYDWVINELGCEEYEDNSDMIINNFAKGISNISCQSINIETADLNVLSKALVGYPAINETNITLIIQLLLNSLDLKTKNNFVSSPILNFNTKERIRTYLTWACKHNLEFVTTIFVNAFKNSKSPYDLTAMFDETLADYFRQYFSVPIDKQRLIERSINLFIQGVFNESKIKDYHLEKIAACLISKPKTLARNLQATRLNKINLSFLFSFFQFLSPYAPLETLQSLHYNNLDKDYNLGLEIIYYMVSNRQFETLLNLTESVNQSRNEIILSIEICLLSIIRFRKQYLLEKKEQLDKFEYILNTLEKKDSKMAAVLKYSFI